MFQNMVTPPTWMALLLLVFVLGMRHGLDADHLVAIDGLTRFNAPRSPRLARFCGMLFSLGHGTVVIAVALAIGAFAMSVSFPQWFTDVGAWISIAFLIALGLVNLHALAEAEADAPVQLVGIKSGLARRLTNASHPVLIASVGGLFALSFDTLTQAALFAATATQFGGLHSAFVVGVVFTLGMLLVDGVNGVWIYSLIARTNRRALIASRIFTAVVSALSLSVAMFGIAKSFSPAIDGWGNDKELAFGIAVLVVVIVGFVASMGIARLKGAN